MFCCAIHLLVLRLPSASSVGMGGEGEVGEAGEVEERVCMTLSVRSCLHGGRERRGRKIMTWRERTAMFSCSPTLGEKQTSD